MKKLLTLLTTFVLALTMNIVVFAQTSNGKITVTLIILTTLLVLFRGLVTTHSPVLAERHEETGDILNVKHLVTDDTFADIHPECRIDIGIPER